MKKIAQNIGLIASTVSLILPAFASAAGIIENPLKAQSLTELLGEVLHGVVRLGLIALLLALVWTGFQFLAAQGAEEKIRSARMTLLWTIVGGLILLGAELIANVIGATVTSLQ